MGYGCTCFFSSAFHYWHVAFTLLTYDDGVDGVMT